MSADAIDRYKRPGEHLYDVATPGIKANFPDLLAALGRSQLARFPQSQQQRRKLVSHYRSRLGELDVRVVPREADDGSADHLMVIDAGSRRRRDAIITELTARQIGSSVHFRPLQTFTWYVDKEDLVGPSGVETASRLDGQILSLPLHLHLDEVAVERVCDAVGDALAEV